MKEGQEAVKEKEGEGTRKISEGKKKQVGKQTQRCLPCYTAVCMRSAAPSTINHKMCSLISLQNKPIMWNVKNPSWTILSNHVSQFLSKIINGITFIRLDDTFSFHVCAGLSFPCSLL